MNKFTFTLPYFVIPFGFQNEKDSVT